MMGLENIKCCCKDRTSLLTLTPGLLFTPLQGDSTGLSVVSRQCNYMKKIQCLRQVRLTSVQTLKVKHKNFNFILN